MTTNLPFGQHSEGAASLAQTRRFVPAKRSSEAGQLEAGGGSERWNFNVLLGGGASSSIASQIAGPQLVLPFLYMALGAPVMFAGLLLPIVQVGQLVSQVVSAPLISASNLRKWYVMLGAITVASTLAIIGLAAKQTSTEWMAVIFLLSAALIGIGQGISSLAYQDVLGRVLPSHRRTTLLYTTVMISGVLTMAITWGTRYLHGGADALNSHIVLLWAGAGIFVLMGILSAVIREPSDTSQRAEAEARPDTTAEGKGFIAELRASLVNAGRKPWFRRYLIAEVLYLPIGLALPFYAIHAASLHHHEMGSLAAFVIATSAGMIAAGPLWHRVGQSSIRMVLFLGSLTAVLAGCLALTIELSPRLQLPLVHSAVFFLIAIAVQGINNALTIYLVELSPEAERTYFLAVGNTVWGGAGILVAFAFGFLAHIQHVAWPLMCIVGLNIAACLYTLRLEPVRESRALLPEPPNENGIRSQQVPTARP